MEKGAAATVAASTKVVRPQLFDGTSSKISGFMTACRFEEEVVGIQNDREIFSRY